MTNKSWYEKIKKNCKEKDLINKILKILKNILLMYFLQLVYRENVNS